MNNEIIKSIEGYNELLERTASELISKAEKLDKWHRQNRNQVNEFDHVFIDCNVSSMRRAVSNLKRAISALKNTDLI